MKPTFLSLLSATLSLLGTAHARTDLEGCISSATTNQWHEASMIWYIPGTGEICDFPDCGGGRAPPKSDNPACPAYTGTATYEPSYLEGYGPGAAPTTTTVKQTSVEATATATATGTSSDDDDEDDSTVTTGATSHGSLTLTSTVMSSAVSSSVLEEGGKNHSSVVISSTLPSSSPSPSSGSTNATETDGGNAAGALRFNAGLGAAGLLAALVL
ncbi:hypothetical protein BJX76DRAFT_344314 [Aspergillus varians]